MNNKGQFSIIAALLVAVVLVAAVAVTYSSIRYSATEAQPQILSSIDETNLGLKELLGFTVGYYGSVIKVTGNMTYAQQLAKNYLQSGLNNIGNVRPELGANIQLINLTLKADWFCNKSYSEGSMYVHYNLTGRGIYGATYNASARLDVQIQNSLLTNQAELIIFRDEAEPLINLGKDNLKIYQYDYNKSSWNLTPPLSIASYINGTYILGLPANLTSDCYAIEVSDTRGLMVEASSFTQLDSQVIWNSSAFTLMRKYADASNPVLGTQSDFNAAQAGPDDCYDNLTEQPQGLGVFNYYPLSVKLMGSTTIRQWSGNVTTDTYAHDSSFLQLHSYPSAFSGTATFGHLIAETNTQNLNGYIRGSPFTVSAGGRAESISAYLKVGSKAAMVKAAIYTSDYHLLGSTPEQSIPVSNGEWVTFNFTTKPLLDANTNYLLVVWGKAGNGGGSVYLYETTASKQGYGDSIPYTTNWPDPESGLSFDNYCYSIYCTYMQATQFTAEAELSGISDSINWQQLTWALEGSTIAGTANYSMQMYNFAQSIYPSDGDGYQNTNLGASDSLKTQTITTNPTNYRNASLGWRILLTATNSSVEQFDLKVDLAQFTCRFTNYALNIEEQWLTLDSSYPRQDLCIKTGNLGAEGLLVQVLQGVNWVTVETLVPNCFCNISLAPYINGATFTLRFAGSKEVNDPIQDTFSIDCVYIKDEPDISFLVNRQQSTFTVEVLQNGTMRWLGQNLEVTTKTIPIPPIPVKALHLNQTINGVNQEVPFQIEDWASNYQIPLGLTSNTTVFGNRQMIVFLLNSAVTDFAIWWNASDASFQTPMAYTNVFFQGDNPGASTYSNGNLTLQFQSGNVKATVAGTGTYSTAAFMRINAEASTYGSGTSMVIHHGIVRDIAMEESEWNTGANNCPNIYANIIIMLPANATYYNYQLRLMFIDSSQQRTITELCPLKLTTSVSSPTLQTENGTVADFPIVASGAATYANYIGGGYTKHHFMQFITDAGKGAGLMFSDAQNMLLYAFDSFPASTSKGTLKTSTGTLELMPVGLGQVQFKTSYDITWKGAVATYDTQTPICNFYDGTTPMGLWILAEFPPKLTVTAHS